MAKSKKFWTFPIVTPAQAVKVAQGWHQMVMLYKHYYDPSRVATYRNLRHRWMLIARNPKLYAVYGEYFMCTKEIPTLEKQS